MTANVYDIAEFLVLCILVDYILFYREYDFLPKESD